MQRCGPSLVNHDGVFREALLKAAHLTSQPASGPTDAARGEVDPGLDKRHLGQPPLSLLGAGRAPRLDHTRPVKEQAGFVDPQLGETSQLVPFGQVGRVPLQRGARLVQVVGHGFQGPNGGNGSFQGLNGGGHGDPPGIGIRSFASDKLTQGVLQRQGVLAQPRGLASHRPADPGTGDMVAVDECRRHAMLLRPGPVRVMDATASSPRATSAKESVSV